MKLAQVCFKTWCCKTVSVKEQCLHLLLICCCSFFDCLSLSLSLSLGAFEDDDVTHVEGDVDPVRDLAIIFEELRLKDESILEQRVKDMEKKTARGVDKKLKPEFVSHHYFNFSFYLMISHPTALAPIT